MNELLKQRLVGALILLALGVVFWPIIFVEPGVSPGQGRDSIPPPPSVDSSSVEPPDVAGLRASPEIELKREEVDVLLERETGDAAPEPGQSPDQPVAAASTESSSSDGPGRTRSEPPVKPALDADGVPIAWILQVASVSSEEKAEQLRLELLALNHKAYKKRIRRGDKTLYRVYIGPKFERAKLESVQEQIDRQFGVSSMISRYVP